MDKRDRINAGVVDQGSAKIPLVVHRCFCRGKNPRINMEKCERNAGQIFSQRRMLGVEFVGVTGDV